MPSPHQEGPRGACCFSPGVWEELGTSMKSFSPGKKKKKYNLARKLCLSDPATFTQTPVNRVQLGTHVTRMLGCSHRPPPAEAPSARSVSGSDSSGFHTRGNAADCSPTGLCLRLCFPLWDLAGTSCSVPHGGEQTGGLPGSAGPRISGGADGLPCKPASSLAPPPGPQGLSRIQGLALWSFFASISFPGGWDAHCRPVLQACLPANQRQQSLLSSDIPAFVPLDVLQPHLQSVGSLLGPGTWVRELDLFPSDRVRILGGGENR